MSSIEALKRRLQEIQDALASLPKAEVKPALPPPPPKPMASDPPSAAPSEGEALTLVEGPPRPIALRPWEGFKNRAFDQARVPDEMALGAREETLVWAERGLILLGERFGRRWVVVDETRGLIGHFEGLGGGVRGVSRWDGGWVIGGEGGFWAVDLHNSLIREVKIEGFCWVQAAGGGLLVAVRKGFWGVLVWGFDGLGEGIGTRRGEIKGALDGSLSGSGRWLYAVKDHHSLVFLDLLSARRVEWGGWGALKNPSIEGLNKEESCLFIKCYSQDEGSVRVVFGLLSGGLIPEQKILSSQDQRIFMAHNGWMVGIDRHKIQFYKEVNGCVQASQGLPAAVGGRVSVPSACFLIEENQSIKEDYAGATGLPSGRLYVFNGFEIARLDLSQWPTRCSVKVEGGLLGVYAGSSGGIVAVCGVRSLVLVGYEGGLGRVLWEHKPEAPVTAAHLEPSGGRLWWCEGGKAPQLFCLHIENLGKISRCALPHAAYVVSVNPRTGWVLVGFAPGDAWLEMWQFTGALEGGYAARGHLDIEAPPRALGFSADGRWMALGTTEGHMALWDLEGEAGEAQMVGFGQRGVGSVLDLWRDVVVNREGGFFISEGGEVCRVGFGGLVEVGLVSRGARCVSGVGGFGRWWVKCGDGLGEVVDLEGLKGGGACLLVEGEPEGVSVDAVGGVVVLGAGWVQRWEGIFGGWKGLYRRLGQRREAGIGGEAHRIWRGLCEEAGREISEEDSQLLERFAKLLWARVEVERLQGVRGLRRKMAALVEKAQGTQADPLDWMDGDVAGRLGRIEASPLRAFLGVLGWAGWGPEEVEALGRLAPRHVEGGRCAVLEDLRRMWAWEEALNAALARPNVGFLGVEGWLCGLEEEGLGRVASVMLIKHLVGPYNNLDILKLQQYLRDRSNTLPMRTCALLGLRALDLLALFESELTLFIEIPAQREALGERLHELQKWAHYSGL